MDSIINWFQDQISTNDFFSGALVISFFGSMLYALKPLPKYLWKRIERKIVYKTTIMQNKKLFLAVEKYLRDEFGHNFRNVEGEIVNNKLNLNHFEDEFVIWIKGSPLFIKKGRQKMESTFDISNAFLISFTIQSLSKKTTHKFLESAIEYYTKDDWNKVFSNQSFSTWKPINTIYKSWDQIYLKNEIVNRIKNHLDQYVSEENKFKRMGIPYKTGILLHGDPGNGKTSIAKAIANYMHRNIYYLNLNTLENDSELINLFGEIPNSSVLLLEDSDVNLSKREVKGDHVSFSAILNCIDGVFSRNDLIVIMMTNHKAKLDHALIRAGRFDLHVEITNPEKNEVERYVSDFFQEQVSIVNYSQDKSMTEIMQICMESQNEMEAVHKITDFKEVILNENGASSRKGVKSCN